MEEVVLILIIVIINLIIGFSKKKNASSSLMSGAGGKKDKGLLYSMMQELKKKYTLKSEAPTLIEKKRISNTRDEECKIQQVVEPDAVAETISSLPMLINNDLCNDNPDIKTSKTKAGFNITHSDLKRGIILSEILAPCLAKSRKRLHYCLSRK